MNEKDQDGARKEEELDSISEKVRAKKRRHSGSEEEEEREEDDDEEEEEEEEESEGGDSQDPFSPKNEALFKQLAQYEKKLKKKQPLTEKELSHYNELKVIIKEVEKKAVIWSYTKFGHIMPKSGDASDTPSDSDEESDFSESDEDKSGSNADDDDMDREDITESESSEDSSAELESKENEIMELYTEQKQQIEEYELKKDSLSEKDLAHLKQLKSSKEEMEGKLLKWALSKIKGDSKTEDKQSQEAKVAKLLGKLVSKYEKRTKILKHKIEIFEDVLLKLTEDGDEKVAGEPRKLIENELQNTHNMTEKLEKETLEMMTVQHSLLKKQSKSLEKQLKRFL